MKTRIHDRVDLDPSAISPPASDGFFVFKYPMPENQTTIASTTRTLPGDAISKTTENAKYGATLSVISDEAQMKRSSSAPSSKHLKAMGGEEVKSSTSSIPVDQDTVNDNTFGNYFPSSTVGGYSMNQRRNSKSLPASPLSSPKLRRRNPYFAAPFERPVKSGWLMSLLSQRKSVEDITALSSEGESPPSGRKDGATNYGQYEKVSLLRTEPKPSELREMNFWAPTSM